MPLSVLTVTQNVDHYLLHHVTYLVTKFEYATSKRFKRKYVYKKRDGRTDVRTDD